MNQKRRNEKRYLMRLKKKKKLNYKNRCITTKQGWKKLIPLLPGDLQAKICIYTWRLYWRKYVPLTATTPSWQVSANNVQSLLWSARQNNIHFLHLPFNTLPENKQWIMGCQCEFCKNDEKVTIMEKHMHSLIQYRNSNYFADKVMPYETTGTWNEKFILSGGTFIKVFDPLCGSYKENKFTKKLREGYKFEFSYIHQ
jgi:hypothetical protein